MRRVAMAVAAMLIASACGGGSADDGAGGAPDSSRVAAAPTAADRCGAGRDSTRAACLAFDTLMKLGHPPRTLKLVQHGKTFCAHTLPGGRPGAEGESVVEVVANRVTRVSLADSAGCGAP